MTHKNLRVGLSERVTSKTRRMLVLLFGLLVVMIALAAISTTGVHADAGGWPTPTWTATTTATNIFVPVQPTLPVFVTPTWTLTAFEAPPPALVVSTQSPPAPPTSGAIGCFPIALGVILVVILASAILIGRRTLIAR